jgi:O-antigen/teichoic acid export membrane protein
VEGVRIALLLSTIERYFSLLGNFVCVVVVSRLMAPEEIGVSVVGMAIIAIALSAREFVSTNYLVQTPELSRDHVRSAFTVMAVFTLVITALLLLLAPTLARLYGDDRLVPYLRVIAFAFLFEVISAPILALFRREMAFGKVAFVNIMGNGISMIVIIGLAGLGFGYMSFAWGWLAATLVISALTLAISPRFWVFNPSLSHWRTMISFGGYNGATMLMQRFYEQMPFLVLGRILSLHYVAIYSRSLLLCQLPDKIIIGGAGWVILPAFSAEVRKGHNLKQPYLHALEIISAIQWPALCLLAILAYPAVFLVLGEQWLEAVPLVRVIAFAMAFSVGFELTYPVLVSLGAMRDMFLRTLIVAPTSVLIICAAAMISLEAVAYSLFIIVPFQALVSFLFVRRHISFRWSELGRSLQRSTIVTLCSASAAFAMTFAVPLGDGLATLPIILCAGFALVGWLFGLWLTDHPLSRELRYFQDWAGLIYRRFAERKV